MRLVASGELTMRKLFRNFPIKKNKSGGKKADNLGFRAQRQIPPYSVPPCTDFTLKLPGAILERIFRYICPHSQDDTYESCERSAVEDSCMLCDLRDLAHCAIACRRWRDLVLNILYHSIRIDTVHYCEREEYLAEQRKRRSFFNHNAEPKDTAQARLRLLCRTLRENTTGLGQAVRFLKIPYMTRETCKTDLARTIAVLPNLRYVDFPEGFFSDDPTCHSLKQEVQARCPNIRKMSYASGAERSFERLAGGLTWKGLEVLELNKLNVDYEAQRRIFAQLRSLRALKLTSVPSDDNLLIPRLDLPSFPPLAELLLEDCKNITVDGLVAWLSADRQAAAALRTLSVTMCSFSIPRLHEVLALAPNLTKLSIIEEVSTRFSGSSIPLLASRSLRILHYEISPANAASRDTVTPTFYSYLTSTLLANGLPSLESLYVRDPSFAESLLDFEPPRPAFAAESGSNRPLSSNNPFASLSRRQGVTNGGLSGGLQRQLEVYTKGGDPEDVEWNFSRVDAAPQPGYRGSMSSLRPLSSYGLAASADQSSTSWTGGFGRGDVRKSTFVTDGAGGFLAVPDSAFSAARPASSSSGTPFLRPGSSSGILRPGSSAGERKASKYNMWR